MMVLAGIEVFLGSVDFFEGLATFSSPIPTLRPSTKRGVAQMLTRSKNGSREIPDEWVRARRLMGVEWRVRRTIPTD